MATEGIYVSQQLRLGRSADSSVECLPSAMSLTLGVRVSGSLYQPAEQDLYWLATV